MAREPPTDRTRAGPNGHYTLSWHERSRKSRHHHRRRPGSARPSRSRYRQQESGWSPTSPTERAALRRRSQAAAPPAPQDDTATRMTMSGGGRCDEHVWGQLHYALEHAGIGGSGPGRDVDSRTGGGLRHQLNGVLYACVNRSGDVEGGAAKARSQHGSIHGMSSDRQRCIHAASMRVGLTKNGHREYGPQGCDQLIVGIGKSRRPSREPAAGHKAALIGRTAGALGALTRSLALVCVLLSDRVVYHRRLLPSGWRGATR